MRFCVLSFTAILAAVIASAATLAIEREDSTSEEVGWWANFKQRVKSVLSRWRDDLRGLWDDVLAKADDMRHWTVEMFENFKIKMKEWLESRKDVPEKEKNDIENFISKLKVPTGKPRPAIDP